MFHAGLSEYQVFQFVVYVAAFVIASLFYVGSPERPLVNLGDGSPKLPAQPLVTLGDSAPVLVAYGSDQPLESRVVGYDSELAKLTKNQLRSLDEVKVIKNYKSMTKAQLLVALGA